MKQELETPSECDDLMATFDRMRIGYNYVQDGDRESVKTAFSEFCFKDGVYVYSRRVDHYIVYRGEDC